jgi:hypothetical protein
MKSPQNNRSLRTTRAIGMAFGLQSASPPDALTR